MSEHLAYTEAGSGPPVVFVHGLACNRSHWEPVIERLPDSLRKVNVDLLGHGDSPRGESADLFPQVAALGALIEHLEIRSPVLVGHSFGAFTVGFAATAFPVRGVINIDQTFDLVAFGESLRPYEERLRGSDFEAAFEDIFKGFRMDLVPDEWRAICTNNIRPSRDVVLEVWKDIFDANPAELQAQVEAALPAVGAPYLAVFGRPISDEELRIQALIPNSTVEIWDGLGHFVQLADPHRTAQRIQTFLEGLPSL